MGRHAASDDSTVSPPRLNPRTLRDLHGTLTASPRDTMPVGTVPAEIVPVNTVPAEIVPIQAADLIARFRESGLLSDVSRRTVAPSVGKPVDPTAVNPPAVNPPLPWPRMPRLDKAVAPKAAAPAREPGTRPPGPDRDVPASVPSEPLRVADLLNRHPDIAARSPRAGHRAGTRRPARADGPTLSVLRPALSITVSVRPVLTVAAIIAAVALLETPNLLAVSHATVDAGTDRATTSTGATTSGVTATTSGATTAAAEAAARAAGDNPRHGATVTTGTSSLRGVSRSTRQAIGAAAHQVPVLKPGQTVPGTWVRPSSGRYTSCFCSRWGSFHAGIDLASKLGTPILAVGDGTVIKAGPASGFGNWVVIQHSNGDVSIYGHMKYFFVHVGQKVTAGEKIAVVGDQGFSTGPHLHFEVHRGGLGGPKINPIPWLKARGIVIGPLSQDG